AYPFYPINEGLSSARRAVWARRSPARVETGFNFRDQPHETWVSPACTVDDDRPAQAHPSQGTGKEAADAHPRVHGLQRVDEEELALRTAGQSVAALQRPEHARTCPPAA